MILEVLLSGPKSYFELPQVPGLDFMLDSLLKQRKIIHSYDVRGIHRYSLPIKLTDEPLSPQKKVAALSRPRKTHYDFGKTGRKKCELCGSRKGRSRYMYDGKINRLCFECSQQ